ncbi:hypothetical protein M407DRAFT_17735 [Tulasnella calospora MUT 4182]|uniref:Uncharacterized protein n=1 Tax=Tulasnella calospora MUT 4182 TaxID=1051891 RepID=A0A0C3QL98_9AGAM|nr:hypothetical protein M407DRAFT_17735 [Tulasnella calospora MUT 4182]
MASGVQALEALLDEPGLSSFTTPLAVGAPDTRSQGIATFRDTRNNLATGSPPAKIYVPRQYGASNPAGESSGATTTVCSCDDKLEALSKQIELVDTEVRELIKSVAELKTEVRDLRSALIASTSVASSEGHLPPATPSRETVEHFASSTPIEKAQANSSSNQYTVKPFISPQGFRTARSQPKAEVTPIDSIPNPVIPVPSYIPLKPPSALVTPGLAGDETSIPFSCSRDAPEVSELATLRPAPPQITGPVPPEAGGPKRVFSGAQLKLSSLMKIGSDRRGLDKGRRLKGGQVSGSWWSSRGPRTSQEEK